MSKLLRQKAEIEARLIEKDPDCAGFLYHGTSHSDLLTRLEPRLNRTQVYKISGKFVFAANEFVASLMHAHKIPLDDNGFEHAGVDVFRSLTGGPNSGFMGKMTYYAVICQLDTFNALFKGGYVYGVKPDGFIERGAGEYTHTRSIAAEFSLRVEGLRDLMEMDVQLFALRDAGLRDEFYYNWRLLEDDNERACLLDTYSKGDNNIFRWLNKEEGYHLADGPMSDW